jgi:RNA polymerase sigma-70 factor, ECF subfamily
MSPDELASLVSLWQPRIRAFFSRRCAGPDDVDDLVQDAIASVIRSSSSFAHRSTLSTWIYAVCRNVLFNYNYYRARDWRLVQKLSTEPPAADPQLPAALRDAIGMLPRDAKRLYALYYVDGLSVREVAARLRRPEGTIKYQLHELRQRVRRLLDS